MATKARNIIQDALKLIQALGIGQSLPAEEASDALSFLNSYLGSVSSEGGMIYTHSREIFNLTGAIKYTIGSGGDFNTTRPSIVTSAYVTNGSTDYTLRMVDEGYYNNLSEKNISGIPEYLYYDGNYPLANIYLYPAPDASYTLTLSSRKPLTEFASLDTDYDMPPEYKRFLVYNLAVEIAPLYEREPLPTVRRNAMESKKTVFAANDRLEDRLMTNALIGSGGVYNIYTGRYD